MLQIYNSLSRKKQPFKTVEPGKVRMYVCGMTVYDFCHLGHARMMVSFDVIARWLRQSGYSVNYVRNITDIDDKIIRRALETKQSLKQVTEFYTNAMWADQAALGVISPDAEPRATEHVADMLDIIQKLEEKGLAYQASDGDVNYSVRKFPGYGKLSGKSLDDLQAGQRVATGDAKQDPLDFVLWKSAKESEPQDSKWDSDYGCGRPGWHIECSAMSRSLLGLPLDIHGGGPDLKFPHHENEIAQTEGAFGGEMSSFWMHCGPLMVDDDKMSKSLGNFSTVRATIGIGEIDSNTAAPANVDASEIDWDGEHAAAFKAAMDDDFNTAGAIAVLFELSALANRNKDSAISGLLKALASILGLLQYDADEYLKSPSRYLASATSDSEDGQSQLQDSAPQLSADEIEAKIQERNLAKQQRDFATADQIRDLLNQSGIELEDKPGGITNWRYR